MMAENSFMKRAGYMLLAALAHLVCATLRITRVNAEQADAKRLGDKPCVIAFWHGSMIPGWFFHRPARGQRAAALVSLSKDGAILASVLEQWGFHLVRGSSHVGGREALHMMVDEVMTGKTLCVTPDGPRGPRHVMKIGAVLAARRARVPLVIAGIAIGKKKTLGRSWDKFEIPMPFSRVCIWYDDPITVPEAGLAIESLGEDTADKRAMNELLESVQARLAAVHAKAHEALGIEPV